MTIFTVLMFPTGFLTDLIWTLYIQRVAERRLNMAAWLSVGTGLCAFVMVEGVVQDPITTILWLAGLWCGTRASGWFEQVTALLFRRRTRP